jgi:hypothetical protein
VPHISIVARAANLQSREDLPSHRSIQGIELLGSVELDQSDSVEGIEQNVIGLVAGQLFGEIGRGGHLSTVSHVRKRMRLSKSTGRVHTLAVEPKAGLVTLARRGMTAGEAREIQLDGVGRRQKL